jgi:hypothetical protein
MLDVGACAKALAGDSRLCFSSCGVESHPAHAHARRRLERSTELNIDVMKPFVFLSTAVVIFGAGSLWLCLPHANAQSTKPAPPTAAQPAAADQQDVQRYNQLMRAQEEKAKRVDTLLVRQEQLMDKQEAAFTRFQKILDTWEQQQAQYQKYLDSLKK